MENPNYYAIIPADVRYDKTLSASEKLFYAELCALANKKGFCYAKNSYFAKLYDVDERTIRRWLEGLKDRGYLDVFEEDGDRKIFVCFVEKGGQKCPKDRTKMSKREDKNVRTLNNNNNNNINNNIYTSNKLDKSDILSLWNRLAEKWGFSKISIVSDERQQKIKARLKDSGCETLYEMFKRIDEAIMGSLFLRGKKQRWANGEWVLENADWRPDFDFFTRKSKFIKAIDGGYDDNDVIEKKNEGKWEQYKNWMNKNWGEF